MAVKTEGQRWRSRHIWYPLEGLLLALMYCFFYVLPLDLASALGGWIGRSVGPKLASSRTADRNLAMIFPEWPAEERVRIIRAMWDNLGRVITEFSKFSTIKQMGLGGRVTVEGAEHIKALAGSDQPALFVSGHMGNWELMGLVLGLYGVPVDVVYREPNNPYAARLLMRARQVLNVKMIPKGRVGARALLATLRSGGRGALLVDQKMNDGVAVPFFGRPAMTASATAEFALRFRCPLIPMRCERLQGAHFRITAYPPLPLPDTGDRAADVHTVICSIHDLLEQWIRERPEQWLWLHRRWPQKNDKNFR